MKEPGEGNGGTDETLDLIIKTPFYLFYLSMKKHF